MSQAPRTATGKRSSASGSWVSFWAEVSQSPTSATGSERASRSGMAATFSAA